MGDNGFSFLLSQASKSSQGNLFLYPSCVDVETVLSLCKAEGSSEGPKPVRPILINVHRPSMIFLPPKSFGWMLHTNDSHLQLPSWSLLQTHVCTPSTPPMVSQTHLSETVLLNIFTNPVLPKTSTSSSKSLRIIFNSSFLKHHINQPISPTVSTFEMSRIRPLLILSTYTPSNPSHHHTSLGLLY